MPKLDDLELKIKQTTDSVDGITKMSNALKRLATNANGLGGIGDSIKKMSDALRHFPNDSAKSVKDFATAMVKLKNTSQYASAIGSSIRQVTRALNDMINAIDVDKLTAIADAMNKVQDASKFARVSTAIKAATKSASGSSSMGDTEATTEVAEGMDEVTEATSEATQSVYTFKDALRDIGSNAKEGLSVVWGGLKKIGSAALTAGKHLMSMGWDRLKSKVNGLIKPIGNLVSSFGRIAMYRALRTAIKAITTGFAEGTKHLYQWSTLVGDNFKNSMDSLATSAHYLRDSLGAMASPLLDALAPAVEVLVEKFVNLLNVVNQFIATFTGKDTWRKAVRTPTTYGDAMKQAADNTRKATKAQKELNKALQGFDELNLITTSEIAARKPTTSAGTADGGVAATEFTTQPVDEWIKSIKDAIEKGDWAGAGKMLADKLNGIIEKWDAKAWGNKLGTKIENGLKFYLSFMENFKFEDLGAKIAAAFGGITEKISAEDMGNALVAHIKAAVKLAKGFFTSDDAKEGFAWVGETLGNAFNELFSSEMLNDLAETIGSAINDAVISAVSFVTTADWSAAGHNIMQALFTAIRTIDWGNAGGLVADLATGLLDAILSAIDYAAHHIDEIFFAIIDFVGGLLKHLWDWLVEKVGGLVGDFLDFLNDTLFGGNEDEGNNRKDGAVSMTPFGDTTSTESSYTAKVNVLYESNQSKIKSEIEMLNKMNAKPKITLQKNGFTGVNDTLKKMTKNRTVMIYANKNEASFKAVSKAIDKLTIDRTATIKFKPVIETSSGNNLQKTIASAKQLTKLLDIATAANGLEDIPQGSLFIAGEVPGQTEMVGNIHGKTGVASGKEITGIADAVYNTGDTEANLLREQNRLLRQILSKNMSVTLAPSAAAGKWVSQSQAAYAKASG